jgi:hypothetical protein
MAVKKSGPVAALGACPARRGAPGFVTLIPFAVTLIPL